MNLLISAIIVVLLSGCDVNATSEEYREKVKKWGASSYYYCQEETGYMMKDYFWNTYDITPKRKFVEYDNGDPVKCIEKGNKNEITY